MPTLVQCFALSWYNRPPLRKQMRRLLMLLQYLEALFISSAAITKTTGSLYIAQGHKTCRNRQTYIKVFFLSKNFKLFWESHDFLVLSGWHKHTRLWYSLSILYIMKLSRVQLYLREEGFSSSVGCAVFMKQTGTACRARGKTSTLLIWKLQNSVGSVSLLHFWCISSHLNER